jgi:undecaprenyl-diphosphatase
VKRDQLLLLTSMVQFALFAPLAWWAHKHPQPPVEVGMTHLLQKKQPAFLHDATLVLSTLSGSAVLLNILVVPTALVLWKRHLRLEAVMTLGISWASALVRIVIKEVVDRPRPSPLLVHTTKRSRKTSFPSGHVASSVGFWGWLFALGMLLRKEAPRWQKGWLSLPLLFVVLVGPSRMYLGDHWLTDVLGGYLFGGGWLCFSLRLYLKLEGKRCRYDHWPTPGSELSMPCGPTIPALLSRTVDPLGQDRP